MKKISLLLLTILSFGSFRLSAQVVYSLQQLKDAAGKNSHQLAIKEYQVQEKISKLKEDEIKKYPAATLDGTYQYNFKLPDITVPAGALGSVKTGNGDTQLLPAQSSNFAVGQKGSYNVGLNLYQPLSQQFKINTGLEIDKTDIKLIQKEKEKTVLQLGLEIEQLYYGTLITQKQSEAEAARLELAKARLKDAEGALAAGKTTGVNLAGLRADIAGEEQSLLKLDIQVQDYLGELSRITELDLTGAKLMEAEPDNSVPEPVEAYKSSSFGNPDMEIGRLNKEKALLGIKAARQSNIPDIGIITGYYVQQGSPVLPPSSPYVGISLKWNLQDLFSNKQVQNQRVFQLKQAEESLIYTKRQIDSDIDKTWRKIKQSGALILAAKKLVAYRRDALKEQQDRQIAGLDIKTAMLETKLRLSEAEVNLYSAQLSNVIAIAELRNLAGQIK
ncbi:TolC family protein [Mucilaginibacter sp. SJ]|uniref:TolC family protein n=1 Tax=Mucilaginibacter sp. SJ TaxID=3029053 RepID=UPI0023A9780C|nr:TolC family protein [Mucilaginibacter sp. SJ]WEA00630.1 TolC family protein [Mucilaginibacter sp. SJ]